MRKLREKRVNIELGGSSDFQVNHSKSQETRDEVERKFHNCTSAGHSHALTELFSMLSSIGSSLIIIFFDSESRILCIAQVRPDNVGKTM